jgi:hypothetical protein
LESVIELRQTSGELAMALFDRQLVRANLFRDLKSDLVGSSQDSPVNCAVAVFCDGSVRIATDPRRPARALARGLEGPPPAKYYFGTAFNDAFPGTLCLALNKAPGSLANKLRVALRGSGFGKVEITVADEGPEE